MEKRVVILVLCLALVILAGCQLDLSDDEWTQLFENAGSCTQDSDCVLAEYSLFDCCPSICSVYAHTKDETELMQQWRDIICIGKPNSNKNKCTGFFDFKGCPNVDNNISIKCIENSCRVVITPTTTTISSPTTTTSSPTTTTSSPTTTTIAPTTTTTTIIATSTSIPAETTTTVTTTTISTTTTSLRCKYFDTFQRPDGSKLGFVENESTVCGAWCKASVNQARLVMETREDSAIIKKWGNPKLYVRVDYKFQQINNSGSLTSCYLQIRGGLRGIAAGIRDDKIAWLGEAKWEYNESIKNNTDYTFSLRNIDWDEKTVDLFVDENYITSDIGFPKDWKATALWWEHGDGGLYRESTCNLDWIIICRE